MTMFKPFNAMINFSFVAALLSGCAATEVAMTKKNLDVQTKTSTSIFIEPISPEKRTIFIDVKSGVEEFDRAVFKKLVREQFDKNDNGYRIIDDPEKAQYVLSAFVLNVEKSSPSASQAALGRGYQGGGMLAGAALGGAARGDYKGALVGGVLGAGADMISGALVKDVLYLLVVDVQIKERAKAGVFVTRDSDISTKVSDNGSVNQYSTEQSNQKEYRTRIVTTANKANLKLDDALEPMYRKTTAAISGFF